MVEGLEGRRLRAVHTGWIQQECRREWPTGYAVPGLGMFSSIEFAWLSIGRKQTSFSSVQKGSARKNERRYHVAGLRPLGRQPASGVAAASQTPAAGAHTRRARLGLPASACHSWSGGRLSRGSPPAAWSVVKPQAPARSSPAERGQERGGGDLQR